MEGAEFFQLGDLQFAWDCDKNRANAKKHGIAFEEAATSWLDLRAIETFDEEHSVREDRYFRLAFSMRGALLVTWFCTYFDKKNESIRIIGSRRATARESRLYEKETQ